MPIKILNNNVNNEELNNLLRNNTLFVGVFSETCSHCINMKPEWNKFKFDEDLTGLEDMYLAKKLYDSGLLLGYVFYE